MIEIKAETNIVINLKLDSRSAAMLMSICQNPEPDEPMEIQNLKKSLFEGIKEQFTTYQIPQ